MALVDLKLFSVFMIFVVATNCATTAPPPRAGNATTAAPSGSTKPPTEAKKPGAIASFGKMLVDIPMGFVEACKDGAEAIEKVVVSVMRGIFSK